MRRAITIEGGTALNMIIPECRSALANSGGNERVRDDRAEGGCIGSRTAALRVRPRREPREVLDDLDVAVTSLRRDCDRLDVAPDGTIAALPMPEYQIADGDVLLVAGSDEAVESFFQFVRRATRD